MKSRIMYNKARSLLAGSEPGSRVILGVGKGKSSQMAGQHRQNIQALLKEFGLRDIKIKESDINTQEIEIISVEKSGDM